MAMNNGKGMNIRIERDEALPPPPRNGKKEDQTEEQESKVQSLLKSLIGGEGGKVKVYRIIEETGERAYCCTLPVDDDMNADFEDAVGKKIGGGRFYIRGWQNNDPVGAGVTIKIDEDLYPRFKSRRERVRDGESPDDPVVMMGAPQQQGSSAMEIMALMEQMRQSESRAAQQIQAQQQQFMLVMMQSMENASARQVELIRALSGSAKPGESGDGISKVMDYVKLFQTLGGSFGGQSQGNDMSDMSFGERVILGPLQTVAAKIGERVGSAVAEMAAPKPQQPAPSQPQSQPAPRLPVASPNPPFTPTANKPTVEKQKEEILQRPKSESDMRLPPGVRTFKPGEVISSPERRAPSVSQAKPTLVTK